MKFYIILGLCVGLCNGLSQLRGADFLFNGERSHDKFEQEGNQSKQPHIVFILLDDLGWSEVGFNAESERTPETPHIDALAKDGVILKRYYVHKFCSPTRSAFQTGRAPFHVNLNNAEVVSHNPGDKVSGYAGIPTKMTTIASVLKNVGYKTHMVGKWDVGVATDQHLPASRGFDSSLIYFEHTADQWTYKVDVQCGVYRDLWEHNPDISFPGRPATQLLNPEHCTYENQAAGCVYEDALFEQHVKDIIIAHPAQKPLFLFWSTHAVHGPYEPPDEHRERARHFAKTTGSYSEDFFVSHTKYYGSLYFIDDAIGRIIATLKEKGLYDNALIVVSSDNGGVVGANNEPLRGGKFTNWEGGIRAVATVSGGVLPNEVRGTTNEGLMAVQDWYATFADLAGASQFDSMAEDAKLPPVDSQSLWPYLSGAATDSPRDQVVIGTTAGGYDVKARRFGTPEVGGIIARMNGKLYKLVLGDGPGQTLECGSVFGPKLGTVINCVDDAQICGSTPSDGCLFDLDEDPEEKNSLAAIETTIFKQLLAQVQASNMTVFAPNRGSARKEDCSALNAKFDNFLGPFTSSYAV